MKNELDVMIPVLSLLTDTPEILDNKSGEIINPQELVSMKVIAINKSTGYVRILLRRPDFDEETMGEFIDKKQANGEF
jgi:hypothetical protein